MVRGRFGRRFEEKVGFNFKNLIKKYYKSKAKVL